MADSVYHVTFFSSAPGKRRSGGTHEPRTNDIASARSNKWRKKNCKKTAMDRQKVRAFTFLSCLLFCSAFGTPPVFILWLRPPALSFFLSIRSFFLSLLPAPRICSARFAKLKSATCPDCSDVCSRLSASFRLLCFTNRSPSVRLPF